MGCSKNETNTESNQDTEKSTTSIIVTEKDDSREPDVRELCWGDSIETVKSFEGTPEEENDSFLAYYVEIDGKKAALCLSFDKTYGLYEAAYLVDIGKSEQASISYGKFVSISEKISEKYGTPTNTKQKLNPLADSCETTAQAIDLGYLAERNEWQSSGNTSIHGTIMESDGKITVMFTFSAADYVKPEPEAGF